MGDVVVVVSKPEVFAPISDVLTLIVGSAVVVVVVVSVKMGFCCGIEVGGCVETGGRQGAMVIGIEEEGGEGGGVGIFTS